MSLVNTSTSRDNNRVPLVVDGFQIASNSQSLIANNTTASNTIFTITGTVEIRALWGVVTTVLSSNITAAFFRLNDGTNTPAITVATGTTLSSAAVGSVITKAGLASAALSLINSSQSRVTEPTTLETTYFSPFIATALPGATTNIEFRYTTTNTPATGAITFYARFIPLSSDGNLIII